MLGSVEVSGLVGKKISQRSAISVLSFMKRVSGSCVAEWWGVERCVLTAHPQGMVRLDRIRSRGLGVQSTSVERVLGPSEHQNMCSWGNESHPLP